MVIITSRNFDRAAAKLPHKIKKCLKERLAILIARPYDIILNNHKLQGSLRHYRSINITGNIRLVYEVYDDDVIRLVDVGTHSDLYGK